MTHIHLRFDRYCSGALGFVLGSAEAFGRLQCWEGTGCRERGEHRPPRRPEHKDFPLPCIPQGLFFDDSYGFYPGQVLIGPAKIFSSVQWLSGVKPVLSTKSKFRVVVEEVGPDQLLPARPLPFPRAQPCSLAPGPC